MKRLENIFFNRSAIVVAKELLGCYLVIKTDVGIQRYKIIETEAYEGPHDRASHAFKGRTQRTEIMFGKAGSIYVYLIYGMYYMLNIVTGEINHPGAVLIRGVEGIIGPGRLSKRLDIDKKINGQMLGKSAGIWIEIPQEKPKESILRTPRIGVTYAGEVWSTKKYRFIYKKYFVRKH